MAPSQFYREPVWPEGQFAPYQVQLNEVEERVLAQEKQVGPYIAAPEKTPISTSGMAQMGAVLQVHFIAHSTFP